MDNDHLIYLNLAYNRIGDEGMKWLVKGLRVNRALLLLSLTQNYISDMGAGQLAEVNAVCVVWGMRVGTYVGVTALCVEVCMGVYTSMFILVCLGCNLHALSQ